jgi:hypothetical protein
MYERTLQKVVGTVLMVSAVLGMQPRRAVAQAPRAPDGRPTVTALVALVDQLPYGDADAVIIRRTDVEPHDAVLLKRSKASAQCVAEALHTLAGTRARHGDIPIKGMVIRVPAPSTPRRTGATGAAVLEMLKRARLRDIPGLGRVPAVTVHLAAQNATAGN